MALYVGLMSGTSMDGIDAALLDVDSNQLIAGLTLPYPETLRRELDCFQSREVHRLQEICQLNQQIGQAFAETVHCLLEKAQYSPWQISAIGSHGQTVCHDANATPAYSLQLGCAHTIAERTGIPVVADFRGRDLVVGGQGAPFAPLYHQVVFASESQNIAVVNIGGIANITCLPANGELRGWDLGPGNCLMDSWIKKHHGQAYDKEGAWAAQGQVIPQLLTALLSEPCLLQAPPKSMDKGHFSLNWLQRFLSTNEAAVDVQATLLQLTATCIARAIHENEAVFSKLYLCGGGVHNKTLCHALSLLLPSIEVTTTAEQGISVDYLEAMMFAWLAEKTMHAKAMNLTKLTGSHHPIILGAIYPVPEKSF